jgi:hypothetical protein
MVDFDKGLYEPKTAGQSEHFCKYNFIAVFWIYADEFVLTYLYSVDKPLFRRHGSSTLGSRGEAKHGLTGEPAEDRMSIE